MALLPACAGSDAPADVPDVVATGTALDGALSVTVVDEASTTRIAEAVVRVKDATGAVIAEGTTDARGELALTGVGSGVVTLDVTGPSGRGAVWTNLGVQHVVIALPEVLTLTSRSVNARWTDGDVEHAVLAAGRRTSLLRTTELASLGGVECALDGRTCAATVEVDAADEHAVVTLHDDAGHATGFVVGQVDATLDDVRPRAALTFHAPVDPAVTGIIGVPGVAIGDRLALLPQVPETDDTFYVPSLDGALDGASADPRYWLVLAGQPVVGSSGDPSARTVLFARGLTSPDIEPRWDAWLAAPEPVLDAAAGVSFDSVDGAALYVVDWLDHDGAVAASAWCLSPSRVEALLPDAIDASEVHEVRVRAIDAASVDVTVGFDRRALELTVTRFSERVVAF